MTMSSKNGSNIAPTFVCLLFVFFFLALELFGLWTRCIFLVPSCILADSGKELAAGKFSTKQVDVSSWEVFWDSWMLVTLVLGHTEECFSSLLKVIQADVEGIILF